MTFLDDSVAPLLNPEATPAEWAEAMNVILMSEFFANTWSVDAGSACRAVFRFENGLCLSWIGDGCGSEPELMQVWIDPTVEGNWFTLADDRSEPIPCPLASEDEDFLWVRASCTWNTEGTPAYFADLISRAVEKYGPCTLSLPWEPFISGGGAVEEASFLMPNDADLLFLDQLEGLEDGVRDEMFAMFEDEFLEVAGPILLAAERNAVTLPSVWGTGPSEVAMGDSWLPPHSANRRFTTMAQTISELPDWVVDWDECCGSCAGSTLTLLAEDKGMTRETAKSLILFGQNAQYYWPPDGSVSYEAFTSDPDEKAVLADQAAQVGLNTTIREDTIHIWG